MDKVSYITVEDSNKYINRKILGDPKKAEMDLKLIITIPPAREVNDHLLVEIKGPTSPSYLVYLLSATDIDLGSVKLFVPAESLTDDVGQPVDGDYNLKLLIANQLGGVSEYQQRVSFTLDTQAPEVSDNLQMITKGDEASNPAVLADINERITSESIEATVVNDSPADASDAVVVAVKTDINVSTTSESIEATVVNDSPADASDAVVVAVNADINVSITSESIEATVVNVSSADVSDAVVVAVNTDINESIPSESIEATVVNDSPADASDAVVVAVNTDINESITSEAIEASVVNVSPADVSDAVVVAPNAENNIVSVVALTVTETTKQTEKEYPATSIDPLILDLNGDGVQTTSIIKGVKFDHGSDGFKEYSGWASAIDGLLALDLNEDGVINSGRELFGDQTLLVGTDTLAVDGFAALGQYDSDANRIINSEDVIYSKLKVWIDADGDGVTDTGELNSLNTLNISQIALSSINVDINQTGNTIFKQGTFIQDSLAKTIADVNLVVGPGKADTSLIKLITNKDAYINTTEVGNIKLADSSVTIRLTIPNNTLNSDVMLILVNGPKGTNTFTHVVTQSDNDVGFVDIALPNSTLMFGGAYNDGGYTLSLIISSSLGGTKQYAGETSFILDTQAPTVSIKINSISDDSGVAGDFTTTDNDGLTIGATLSSALVAGQILEYSNDNGLNWVNASGSVSSTGTGTAVSHVDSALKSTATVHFRVMDTAGNSGTAASQLIKVVDNSAPNAVKDTIVQYNVSSSIMASQYTGGLDISLDSTLRGITGYTVTYTQGTLEANGTTYLSGATVSASNWVDVKLIGASVTNYDLVVEVFAALQTDEDTAITIDVLANDSDVDGDTLSISQIQGLAVVNNGASVNVIVSTLVIGTAKVVNNKIVFTPGNELDKLALDEVKEYSFEYKISDGTLEDTATVTINVVGTNDAPILSFVGGSAYFTNENASFVLKAADILSNATDIDKGDTLALTSVTALVNTKGTVSLDADKNILYTPDFKVGDLLFGDSKDITFSYTVTDSQGLGVSKEATITVNGVDNEALAPTLTLQITKGVSAALNAPQITTSKIIGATINTQSFADINEIGTGYISTSDRDDTINSTAIISTANIDTYGGDDSINTKLNIVSSSINTGEGNDSIEALTTISLSRITTDTGNDSIKALGIISNNTLDTGAGDDSIISNKSIDDNIINTQAGNDIIDALQDIDGNTIDAGAGDDVIHVSVRLIDNTITMG